MQTCARPSPRHVEALILEQTYDLEVVTWGLYREVGGRLGDARAAESARSCCDDHHQHVIALRTRLALLGVSVGAASRGPGLRGAGQRLLSRIGPLRALLAALERQERLMLEHYRSLDLAPLSRASRALVQRSLCEERDHHGWLRRHVAPQLAARAAPMPARVVTHMATRHWAHARL